MQKQPVKKLTFSKETLSKLSGGVFLEEIVASWSGQQVCSAGCCLATNGTNCV